MSKKFDDFVREVEERSTPAEREELESARARFKVGGRNSEREQGQEYGASDHSVSS